MAAAPWETPDATPTAIATPAASGTFAPWETPTKAAAAPSGSYLGNWASGIADQAKKLVNTPYTLKTDVQTVAALASGAVAPIAAAGGNLKWSVDDQGNPVAEEDPNDHSTYRERKAAATYQPTDPNAQARVGLIGAASKPIGDALHHVASVFTDDPDTQEAIADTLGIASTAIAPALGGAKSLIKFGRAAPVAEDIITHPAVVAANDLADKYNIKLTKGQQVQQAATDLGPEDTATAKALTVPYQIEAKAATQPTVAGKTYNNHFSTQQNTLAGHVQDVADAVRAAGDDATATKIENTLVDKSPGVQAVNGNKLQTVVSKGLIDDPALAGKLNELNDLSGVIDPPPKAPVAPATIVSKIADKFANLPTAVGGSIGGAAGFKVGSVFGHPILGAEAGASLGASAANKIAGAFSRGPGDISTLTTADITKMAKAAGISPEQMAQRLAARPPAPAAASSVSGGPLVEPTPQIASPAASPSPDVLPSRSMPVVDGPYSPETVASREMPTVQPDGISFTDHNKLMQTDAAYRKAALLKAGIIEDAPAATAAAATPGAFPPALLDNATWKKYLADNPLTEANQADRMALTEAREDAMRAQGINPRAQPGSFFSGHPELEARISNSIADRLEAGKQVNYLQHKLMMERDPQYRAAALLKAGIIDDLPAGAPTMETQLRKSIAMAKARKQGGSIDPDLLMAPFKAVGKIAPYLDDAAAAGATNGGRDQ